MVEKFYLRSCVTKAKAKANNSKATSSDTNNNDKVGDEEMEDVNDSGSQQPLASLQDVSEELTAAASTANSYRDMSKTNNPVKYGELAVIGKKKKEEDDEDMNIN